METIFTILISGGVSIIVAAIPAYLTYKQFKMQLQANERRLQQERESAGKELTTSILDAIQKRNSLEEDALKCILRTHILNCYSKHSVEQNFSLTLDESENLHKLFESYTALGGNSFASNLYHIMNSWKIVED